MCVAGNNPYTPSKSINVLDIKQAISASMEGLQMWSSDNFCRGSLSVMELQLEYFHLSNDRLWRAEMFA